MSDLDELERLARESRDADDSDWPSADDIGGYSGCSWCPIDAAYIAAASPDVILELIARVRAAEGDAQRWRGRVTRLKASVAQTAAAMSRRGHYEIAQRLVAGYDEIIATEAASEDFVTAQPATTKP